MQLKEQKEDDPLKQFLRPVAGTLALLLVLLTLGCGGESYVIPAPTGPVTEPTAAATQPVTTAPVTTAPPTEAPTEPPTEPGPEITTITMTFVGDCTLGRNHIHPYSNSFDALYDEKGADYFLEKVRDLFTEDDVTVINLEGPLTTSNNIVSTKEYCHKGKPEYVSVLTGASVEIATLGNNHIADYGKSGAKQTQQVLEEAGIAYAYDNIQYLVYEVKGVKIGLVSVNEFYYGTKVRSWLKEGYNYLRGEKDCQIVIAAMHWGEDKWTTPEKDQVTLGHDLVDMGYDLIIGHHSHVLQAMEVYKGKTICYSLGNFCYGGSKYPKDLDAGIYRQTFTFEDGVLVRDQNFQFIPCRISGTQEVNNYQPYVAEGEEAQRILDKMNGYSAPYGLKLDSTGRPVAAS